MITYTFFSPDNLNRPLGVIDNEGHIIRGVMRVDAFIISARKGSASNKENNFLCIADVDQPTEIDVITLGELLGRPSKPKDENCVSDLLKCYFAKKKELREEDEVRAPVTEKAEVKDLSRRVIKSGNRYMSKVEWDSKKIRKKIKRYIASGRTLSYIARCLEVSRSTLSKANKRYQLYATHLYRINQC